MPHVQHSDMNMELQSEAMDLIISSIEKNPGNFEVRTNAKIAMLHMRLG